MTQKYARKTKNKLMNAFRVTFYICSLFNESYQQYDLVYVINIVNIFKYRDQEPTHRTP